MMDDDKDWINDEIPLIMIVPSSLNIGLVVRQKDRVGAVFFISIEELCTPLFAVKGETIGNSHQSAHGCILMMFCLNYSCVYRRQRGY